MNRQTINITRVGALSLALLLSPAVAGALECEAASSGKPGAFYAGESASFVYDNHS